MKCGALVKYMKIIVTGGAGFIGSNLVDQLVLKGHRVTVIDNFVTGSKENLKKSINKIKLVKKSILDKSITKYFTNIDCVFHLAGLADIVPSINNPKKYFDYNVNGTLNVLECMKANNVKKIIYSASASCYGKPKKFPTSENSEIDTKYPYALTKYLAEQLVMHWGKIYKFDAISTRFFNVYGPRSRTSGAYGAVFGVFLAQKINNKPLTIVGSGKQTRDFIHVIDLVAALLKILNSSKKDKIYNIASGKETSVNKIAKLIGGKKIMIPKRPGEPDRSLGDIRKIKKELRWSPKISIEHGVNNLLKNLQDWKKAPIWTPEKIKKETKMWFKFLT